MKLVKCHDNLRSWRLLLVRYPTGALLVEDLARLEQSLPGIGLKMNLRKCVLVSWTLPESTNFPRQAEVTTFGTKVRASRFWACRPAGEAPTSRRSSKRPPRKWQNSANKLWTVSNPKWASSFNVSVVEPVVRLNTRESKTLVEAVDKSLMDSALIMLRAPCSEVDLATPTGRLRSYKGKRHRHFSLIHGMDVSR